jgi:O-methyltransferase involved in polyketide biosynthesis
VSGAWDIASGAGVTALGLAAARAVESGRDDRLIDRIRALAERYGRDLGNPFSDGHELAAEPPWLDTMFTTANLSS